MNKIDLKGLSLPEIEALFLKIGEKKFRAAQVYAWIYKYGHTDFSQMTNLGKEFREKLSSSFSISTLSLSHKAESIDGTTKFLWKLSDHKEIESVLIPDDDRLTACVSSQVGCALACTFCATGKMGFTRNLTSGEIYDQIYAMNEWAMAQRGQHITNIVFMGMGEPLMNLPNVQKAIDLISHETGTSISKKRITISTAGVAHKIIELADSNPKTKLAVSVHSAISEKRNQIMPINRGTDLTELTRAIQYYTRQTKQRVTYEYVLFDGFNDGDEDARALIKLSRSAPSKVNIIMYNPVAEVKLKRATNVNLNHFINLLVDANIIVMVRQSRGQDIAAACGQLATEQKEVY